ncbi:Hypothetical predicted protein [Cloeon dipterum]|uniref:UDENN FLCN/SMCR8-type domain-containing protein n=1 Tax=Cloeon dipterum TaxID=197152 RepID=A0A8S1DVK5_9INSE|nr:Hypothetical predicted protein [Cloeon dipterum]
MASTYTEAALFVDDAEEVVEAESQPQNSPAATQAPLLLNPKDPCSFCSEEDFIVFSEFSEVVGPYPLLTVPPHIHDETEIDMNNFILKIMSVDYQANPSGQFILAEDAQVLHTLVIPGVHAYVHYFTLHDLHARGFVRPMCLAFVTRDKNKLEKMFLQLRESFLRVTEYIKLDNRQGFLEDIKHALQCLRSTQEQYFKLRKLEDEHQALTDESKEFLNSIDLEQLVNQYAELKNLFHIVEPSLAKEAELDELKDWSCLIKNSDLPEVKRIIQNVESHTPRLINMSGSRKSRYIRPVVSISPWGFSAAMWKLMDLQNYHQAFPGRGLHFREMTHALENADFLRILNNLTDPKEWRRENSLIIDNRKDYSSSESNCSFHSAKPSLQSSSTDSFGDLEKPLSDWALNENVENTWSDCLWSEISLHGKPGHRILEFFSEYSSAARHLIYSILIGRTVILAGPKNLREKAVDMISALTPLIPNRDPKSVLEWHQGILVSFHLDHYKLVGLCVPERLTVHELINSLDKNRVTILDLISKQLLGPAYSGSLLSTLSPSAVALHKSDQSLILMLHAVLCEIDQKVSLCRLAGQHCLSDLGLHGCDASIVKADDERCNKIDGDNLFSWQAVRRAIKMGPSNAVVILVILVTASASPTSNQAAQEKAARSTTESKGASEATSTTPAPAVTPVSAKANNGPISSHHQQPLHGSLVRKRSGYMEQLYSEPPGAETPYYWTGDRRSNDRFMRAPVKRSPMRALISRNKRESSADDDALALLALWASAANRDDLSQEPLNHNGMYKFASLLNSLKEAYPQHFYNAEVGQPYENFELGPQEAAEEPEIVLPEEEAYPRYSTWTDPDYVVPERFTVGRVCSATQALRGSQEVTSFTGRCIFSGSDAGRGPKRAKCPNLPTINALRGGIPILL